MRASDEDALICDFAQYYGIYDLKALPVGKAAILACGLPKESRTMRKRAGDVPDKQTIYMASLIDTVRSIEYAVFQSHSKKKIQRPESLLKKLLGTDKDGHNEIKGVSSVAEFEAERSKILQGA